MSSNFETLDRSRRRKRPTRVQIAETKRLLSQPSFDPLQGEVIDPHSSFAEQAWPLLQRHCVSSGNAPYRVIDHFSAACYYLSVIREAEKAAHGSYLLAPQLHQVAVERYGEEGAAAFECLAEHWYSGIQHYLSIIQPPRIDPFNLEAVVPSRPDVHSEGGGLDALGSLYMLYGAPNEAAGQFFTPWEVCVLMSQMTLSNPPTHEGERASSLFLDRLRAYWEAHPAKRKAFALAQTRADVNAMRALSHVGAELTYHNSLACSIIFEGLFEGFDPVTICDPCCGSGRTVLSMVHHFPLWAVRGNLVQMFGSDIDRRCIRMFRANAYAILGRPFYSKNPTRIRDAYSYLDGVLHYGDLDEHAARRRPRGRGHERDEDLSLDEDLSFDDED